MFDRTDRGLYWDAALRLVDGCTPCSPGCEHCWAAAEARMRSHNPNEKIRAQYAADCLTNGRFNGHVRFLGANLKKPYFVKKPTVYAVWNDLFHPGIPEEHIWSAVEMMVQNAHHIFLLLTKRPERMRDVLTRSCWWNNDTPPNIWLGATVESQQQIDHLAPLLATPAARHYLSAEPLLGPLDLSFAWRCESDCRSQHILRAYGDSCRSLNCPAFTGLDWIIAGPETGPGARPANDSWFRSLRDECHESNGPIPFFLKGRLPLDNQFHREVPAP